MKIFILGATGFIGNALYHELVNEHEVIAGSRFPIDGCNRWKRIDFFKENNWDELLSDTELVINAVGIIEGDFEKIQNSAPIKLFETCIKKRIKIINISAIGAEKTDPVIPFLTSKKSTDSFLLLYDNARIIYPGIVIGKNASSTKFFAEMAQFPVIPIINTNNPPPFIHISQLTALVKKCVNTFDQFPKQTFAVSKPESLEKIISVMRGKKAVFIKIPVALFNFIFFIFPAFTIGIFNKNMLFMLQSIHADDYTPLCEEASTKIISSDIESSNYFTEIIAWTSIAFIWLWSGISSFYSWNISIQLMKEIGANSFFASFFVYAGGITDIVLGMLIISKKLRKRVLVIQIIFIFIYTCILSILQPHYWMHPFGVLSKNIPLLALSLFLLQRKEN